jgi:hypothetical protein
MVAKNTNLKVIFTLEETEPELGQVIITPQKNSWNDFGYQVRCSFVAKISKEFEAIGGDIFVGFLPRVATSKLEIEEFYNQRWTLTKLIEASKKSTVAPENLPPFFTILPDLKSYRYIVSRLKPKGANEFLTVVRDLVAHKETENNWVEKALATDVFKLGFMRNSEPFFAFNNADSVLAGVELEDFSTISKSLDLNFSLEGLRSPHKIKFRFSDEGLIPRRINILIGKNGLGKSLALKNFCRAALRYQDTSLSLTDTESDDGRPMISRVLAIATPGETRNTFPAERKKDQKLYYRRLNLTRGGKSATSRSIGEALVRLARSDEFIGANTRWDLFVGALSQSLPIDSLVIPLNSGEFIPLIKFRQGSEQRLLDRWANVDKTLEPSVKISGNNFPLSSGQLTFFKLALLCCLYIENGSFVLMDEPETHLHPNLISDLVDMLDYLLEHTGSHAILATHSAYFVREVPREQVHVFQKNIDGSVSVDQPRLKTFGANVDSISQFVFGEDSEIRLTDKIYEKVRGRSFQSVDAELNDQLSLAALMDIRRRLEGE